MMARQASSIGVALSDFGSYFVGGRYEIIRGQPTMRTSFSSAATVDRDPNGRYRIEQAYVQYFVPQARPQELPILFVHGGGLTGSCWETTPDGRPGWLHFFLRAGFVCHVIDNAERGRAGFCPFPGIWAGDPIHRSLEEAWTLYRFGTQSVHELLPFEGTQFPTEHTPELMARHVPRWLANEAVLLRNLNSALESIGPSIVIAHSQGGGLALRADADVRACITLEPHGVPAEAPSWLTSGPILSLFGDFLDPFWTSQAKRTEASFSNWRLRGADALLTGLPSLGIHGNSHMPMMDRNSEEVAGIVLAWLRERRLHIVDP
jgi:pimeloyl-ACP methyl ester carboxylesterase